MSKIFSIMEVETQKFVIYEKNVVWMTAGFFLLCQRCS